MHSRRRRQRATRQRAARQAATRTRATRTRRRAPSDSRCRKAGGGGESTSAGSHCGDAAQFRWGLGGARGRAREREGNSAQLVARNGMRARARQTLMECAAQNGNVMARARTRRVRTGTALLGSVISTDNLGAVRGIRGSPLSRRRRSRRAVSTRPSASDATVERFRIGGTNALADIGRARAV